MQSRHPPTADHSAHPAVSPQIPLQAINSLIPRLTTTINDIDAFKNLLAAGNADGSMPNWYDRARPLIRTVSKLMADPGMRYSSDILSSWAESTLSPPISLNQPQLLQAFARLGPTAHQLNLL